MQFNVTWFIHFVLYYLTWILCIYYAAHDAPYLGPVLALILIAMQVVWQIITRQPYLRAVYFALGLALLGTLLDTIWLHAGFVYFKSNPFEGYVAAPWMTCLWLSFGLTLIVNSEPLLKHYVIWGLLALVFLPISYWLGVVCNAAQVNDPFHFYLYLGLVWSVLLPISFIVYLSLTRR